jgi:hypothetical protein
LLVVETSPPSSVWLRFWSRKTVHPDSVASPPSNAPLALASFQTVPVIEPMPTVLVVETTLLVSASLSVACA